MWRNEKWGSQSRGGIRRGQAEEARIRQDSLQNSVRSVRLKRYTGKEQKSPVKTLRRYTKMIPYDPQKPRIWFVQCHPKKCGGHRVGRRAQSPHFVPEHYYFACHCHEQHLVFSGKCKNHPSFGKKRSKKENIEALKKLIPSMMAHYYQIERRKVSPTQWELFDHLMISSYNFYVTTIQGKFKQHTRIALPLATQPSKSLSSTTSYLQRKHLVNAWSTDAFPAWRWAHEVC